MANYCFYINKGFVKKDGSCAIYIHATIGGKQVKINTGVSVVYPDNWDMKRNLIKGATEEVKDDNLILKNCASRVNNVFVKYRLRERELTADLFYKEYQNPTLDIDFYKFWEVEMKEHTKDIVENTLKQHKSVLNKLKEYKSELAFSELTMDFIQGFSRYCIQTLKNKNSTFVKQLKTIEYYINRAIYLEKIDKNPFENLKIIKNTPKVEFLEPHELEKLIGFYKKNILPANCQRGLRHYLFCCFTGLRISDLRKVKKENIIGNTLAFIAHKTKRGEKIVKIPLIETALALIKDEDSQTNVLFIVGSDQHERRMIKTVMDACGVRYLKFHSSRHTFATNYLRAGGLAHELMELLGHSKVDTTMIYVHAINKDKENNIAKLDKLW